MVIDIEQGEGGAEAVLGYSDIPGNPPIPY